jgi:uroporphyrin-III C-methyltransferase/precorrin-2 dehydrogenase/sirohydrochlorin ferrochelatase
MRQLLPLFLDVTERDVLLVGGGSVASTKLRQLLAVGACVRIVAPEVCREIEALAARRGDGADGDAEIVRREFVPADLEGAWLVVAAATPELNRQVAEAADARRIFVNAVDDPANATAFMGGVIRRDDVTIAVSTSGDAPALTALVREALDATLPRDLGRWVATARAQRAIWRRDAVPIGQSKPRLLRELNRLYEAPEPKVPWLSGPEDSWL